MLDFLLRVALLGKLSQYFAMIKINLLEKSSMVLNKEIIMEIFNYIAGSEFPPSLSDKFEFCGWRRRGEFCPSVVIFVLADQERDTSYQCQRLAEKLLRSQEMQGIVYSFFPENRDFLKCSRFFGVSDYPAYVIVPFPIFVMLSVMLDNGNWHRIFHEYRRCWYCYCDRDCRNRFRHCEEWHFEEWYHELSYLMHHLDEKHPRFSSSVHWDELGHIFQSDEAHSFYKIVNNAEFQDTSTLEDKLNLVVKLAYDVCNSLETREIRRKIIRQIENFHENMYQFMVCHNHLAGSSFPPNLLNENESLCLKVVIFSLKNAINVADQLAEKLRELPEFQGLVYHLDSENRDFMKCAKFFSISSYPAYVIVPYTEFKEFLHDVSDESKELHYAVINAANLDVNTILKEFRNSYDNGMPCSLKMQNTADLRIKTEPLKYYTEITVLIPTARGNHSDLDALLYEVFMKFGSLTDDVLVRILHPTFISDEYQKALTKYQVSSLPCAIFIDKATNNIVVTIDRDAFEAISEPTRDKDKLGNLISDIHLAITMGKLDVAKQKAKPIHVTNREKPGQTLIFEPKTVIVGENVNVGGSIIGGDNVQGDQNTLSSTIFRVITKYLY